MRLSPRVRRYNVREQRILDDARRIAESEGWPAVTTHRLAQEIEHSQPVIYQHFSSREHLIGAVVRQGFAELTGLIRDAGSSAEGVLERLCWSYLDFGKQHSAVPPGGPGRPALLHDSRLRQIVGLWDRRWRVSDRSQPVALGSPIGSRQAHHHAKAPAWRDLSGNTGGYSRRRKLTAGRWVVNTLKPGSSAPGPRRFRWPVPPRTSPSSHATPSLVRPAPLRARSAQEE